MKFKRVFFILVTLILLFTISSANALEDNSTSILQDNALDDISNPLDNSAKSFSDLNNLINSNNDSDIYLNNDYSFVKDSDSSLINGVLIDREVTIHGNGFTLNGNSLARIFKVTNKNVVFRDITFINGYTASDNGGAIYGQCTAIDCTFENNKANWWGGAMYKGNAIGCTFRKNYAFAYNPYYDGGGAMIEGTASNCIFENNGARFYGGALSKSTAVNCTFIGNNADRSGGAVYMSTSTDCTFRDNTVNSLDYGGGAMYGGFAENCNFISNSAPNFGGAICNGDALNCYFYNNRATYNGGAMYSGIAVKCNFENNYAECGGAILSTNAVLCTFTNNAASSKGKAMFRGISVQCKFYNNDNYDVKVWDNPVFTASDFSSVYNSGDKLSFNLKADNQDLNNVPTTIKIYQNGKLVETVSGLTGKGWTVNLAPGIYNAVLSVDDLAGKPSATATLSISQCPTSISAADITTFYGEENYFKIVLKDKFGKAIPNTQLTVDLEGIHTYVTDANGEVKIPTVNMELGTYIADITFAGNENYIKSGNTAKITVTKIETYFDFKNTNAFDLINHDLIITLKDYWGNDMDDVISVDVSGIKNYTINKKGQIIISAKDLPAGIYSINASFCGNEHYSASIASAEMTVLLIPTAISGDDITTYYANNENFIITLTDNQGNPLSNFTVTADFNGSNDYITDENGQFKMSTSSLTPGVFFANISFNGSEKYSKSNHTVKVNVEKSPVQIYMYPIFIVYNHDELIITLMDHYYKRISDLQLTVLFDTLKNYTTDENGEVRIPIKDKEPNVYSVSVLFAGNDLYQANNITFIFPIYKDHSYLYAEGLISDYNPDGYFTIKLTDGPNRPLGGMVLDVDFDGIKEYVTDDNGQVKVSTGGLSPGSYWINVYFNENKYYYSSHASYNLIISKSATQLSAPDVIMTYGDDKDLIINLKDNFSRPISGMVLTVDFNGIKEYVTDENGQVIISTAGLTPDDYPVSIKFEGNENYTASNTDSIVMIDKKRTPVDVNIDVLENDITVSVDVNSDATGFVRFEITGLKNYTFYSEIKNGKAVLYCTLLDGFYDIKVTYLENSYYHEDSTSQSFVIGNALFGKNNNLNALENAVMNLNPASEDYELLNADSVNSILANVNEKAIGEFNQTESSHLNKTTKVISSDISPDYTIPLAVLLICIIVFAGAVVIKKKS